MAEPDLFPFIVWSLAAFAIVVATGLSYRAFLKRRKNETAAS